MTTATSVVRELWEDHRLLRNRDESRAMSLEALTWLWAQLEARPEPLALVDFGSGLSSWVLRAFQQLHVAVVWTTDHSDEWLGVTRDELAARGLSTEQMLNHQEFRQRSFGEYFDVVVNDLGTGHMRAPELPFIDGILRPGGLLVLDDWHKDHVRDSCSPELDRLGYVVTEIPETLDMWGRYVATAVKR